MEYLYVVQIFNMSAAACIQACMWVRCVLCVFGKSQYLLNIASQQAHNALDCDALCACCSDFLGDKHLV